jgi:anti-sigma-K factor RskA
MSGAEANDSLAGEYVLGLLDDEAAAAVLRAAATDERLASAIDFWQARLAPLADGLPPVPPTRQLWARIAADIAEKPSLPLPLPERPLAPRLQPGFWRPLAIGGLLLAACLAAFIAWSENTAPSAGSPFQAVALLAAPGSISASARLQVLASGEVVVVPLQKLVLPPGRQMDLWAWPRERPAPLYLGTIRPDGGAIPLRFPPRDGTPVMITSERLGEGPPAEPGPTLYAGLLTTWR